MHLLRPHLAWSGLLALTLTACQGEAPDAGHGSWPSKKPPARNIILLISDGAGFAPPELCSLYRFGASGLELVQSFPVQLAMSTWSADGARLDPRGYDPQRAWSDFDYVRSGATDSAAAATAMATGVKTRDGVLGLDPAGQRLPNLVERAEALGLSTGVITTVPFSHATPAGFAAHGSRQDYAGIAAQMVQASGLDVIMGTGHPWFDDDGQPRGAASFDYVAAALWGSILAGTAGGDADGDGVPDPWTLVQERAQLQQLASGPAPRRLIAVPKVGLTLQQSRSGNAAAPPFAVPLHTALPTLAEMTRAALNVLDDNPRGFFLMIEGGAVDWAAHANQPGRLIEEELGFLEATEAVAAWVKTSSNWGETVVIVTSDHETGYITGPGSGPTAGGPVWTALAGAGAGQLPGFEYHSREHTNSLVPLFAKGDAARLLAARATRTDPVRGPYLDNTDVAAAILQAMGQ
jgi:alkaline phosphatase